MGPADLKDGPDGPCRQPTEPPHDVDTTGVPAATHGRPRQRHPAISILPATTADSHAAIVRDDVAVHAVRAVLDGDREAFAVLVERDLPGVTRTCYRVLGNAADAEDAAQEAFVAAFRSLPDWRGDGPFTAWVARIAVRIAIRRAHQRRPVDWIDVAALEGPDELLDGGGRRVARHFAGAAADAAEANDPGRVALAAEQAATVRDALRGLEEPYRETVALRYFAGLTVPEIAETCDRPQGTVKTHLHRGLLRLRERLDAQEAAR